MTDQTSSTGRVEAFSDGVFAIAITLLVLEIAVPGVDALREHRGSLLLALLSDWPVYLAYVATFLAVGTIWLNHHAFFGRLERVDGPVLWWNLMLLLGVSVLPFPNALVARYLGADLWNTSARTATAVYAFVFLLGSVPWFFLARHVLRHPELLRPEVDLTFQRRDSRRSVIGIVGYAVAVPIAYLVPIGVLVLLAGAAVFYIVTARGFAAPRPS